MGEGKWLADEEKCPKWMKTIKRNRYNSLQNIIKTWRKIVHFKTYLFLSLKFMRHTFYCNYNEINRLFYSAMVGVKWGSDLRHFFYFVKSVHYGTLVVLFKSESPFNIFSNSITVHDIYTLRCILEHISIRRICVKPK